MQYHLNGFSSGDPGIAAEVPSSPDRSDVDVLLIGCGPAGLALATQLAGFPDIVTRIVDRKPGPLEVGQADGIACRSMEMFQAFGFADKVEKEAYWVNEVAFWRPADDTGRLARADRIQDVEDGLSEFPHVILNQARVHDFFLEEMARAPARLTPDYNRELVTLTRTGTSGVLATFDCLDDVGQQETIRAQYVVGCDGARSIVRATMGHVLKGEAARQLWGVMDVLAVTDFPDIRLKCAIQSADQGSLLIIPREGGYMVRLYIELDVLQDDERASDRNVTPQELIAKAQAILAPHSLDVKQVVWWSAYEIGQRVCDQFDDVADEDRGTVVPRIFIAGDACHTHSPKAGQGMNVSMADTFNLGWKLASVIRGQAAPAMLDTYTEERRSKAKELIDFDRDMARLFSAKPKTPAEADLFQQYFKTHGRYTAGVETRYAPSLITGDDNSQHLATGFPVGMRFHSAPVVRVADARRMHLGHTLRADGRWRLFVFAGRDDHGHPGGAVAALADGLLTHAKSPVVLARNGGDIDAVIDVRAVFQASHDSLDITQMPDLLLPAKGRFRLLDYEKVFAADHAKHPDIFDARGIDREHGALVIVRPDQYVSAVLPLTDQAALRDFFARFQIAQAADG